jgi:hypothetical protein
MKAVEIQLVIVCGLLGSIAASAFCCQSTLNQILSVLSK